MNTYGVDRGEKNGNLKISQQKGINTVWHITQSMETHNITRCLTNSSTYTAVPLFHLLIEMKNPLGLV